MNETEIPFRPAQAGDLEAIVALLADDALGARREQPADPLPEAYRSAFEAIAADPNNELIVADDDGAVVAVLQLTFIPGLTRRGGWRAQIEGVRVASTHRSTGLGSRLVEHAVARARSRRCILVQLTTDKSRPRAIRFYKRLGFIASHEGMKRPLE
ncbi:MAG: GNAT family N-acetyltransferase [Wenzhouxiangellaceae bacterium]|nr:GNAT family N-acetyltransferase [Wenzhouxiangellaceae bacterium]